jgi:putative tryptophan/tyrosine transport system substrate-binding protein
MKRRDFLALGSAAAVARPQVAHAQQPEQMRRIGVLLGLAENDTESNARLAAFRQGLAKRGWSEGRNVQLDYRFADANAGRHEVLAKELVALQPDAILAHTPRAAIAIQRESHVVSTVFVNVSDPVGLGLVTSLARPGSNFTGVQHYEATIMGKWLAMLKEIAPRLARAAFVANPKSGSFDFFLRAAHSAAPSLAVEIVPMPVESAADIERSIDSFARTANGGLVFSPDVTTIFHRDPIITLAARHRLPAVYPFQLFSAAGGLMSYGTDQVDMFRLASFYVDRILRGDKPANLPVQAPVRFETTLNLRTAKALGFDVPPSLLVRADEVIE